MIRHAGLIGKIISAALLVVLLAGTAAAPTQGLSLLSERQDSAATAAMFSTEPENMGEADPTREYRYLSATEYRHLKSAAYANLTALTSRIVYQEPEETDEDRILKLISNAVDSPLGLCRQVTSYKYTVNSNISAWIYIPGTSVSYPVLASSKSNPHYYLDYNMYGRYDTNGAIYADYEVIYGNRNAISQNTVLFGHNWYCGWEPPVYTYPEGSMFAQLSAYRRTDFASEHPYIYYATEQEEMCFQVFAAFHTTGDNTTYLYPNNPRQVAAAVAIALSGSVHNFGVSVSGSDKILTLSTCSWAYYTNGNGRFVVMAKLIS